MVAAKGNQYAAIPAARRAEIIEAVAAGISRGTPLTLVCESLQASGRFTAQSLYNWLRNDPEAKLAIEYAKTLGHDWLAHECLEIADDRSEDVMHDTDGTARPNSAAVLRAKVRVWTRLQLLSKWSPAYAENRTVKLEGELQQTVRHTIDPRSLPAEQREALRSLIEHAASAGLLPSPDTVDAEYEELAPGGDAP
jgi:hypothetical protein